MRAALSFAIVVVLPFLAGCDLSMTRQARYDTEAPSSLWPDGASAHQAPAGTVAFGTASAPAPEPPDTPALLARGAERYEIFCTPCHGRTGRGDGTVVARGFPAPPDFHGPGLEAASDQHLYDVITNGFGAMYDFGSRIAPSDRWAIVAYIRALQARPEAPEQIAQRPAATAVLPHGAAASALSQSGTSR